MGEVSSELYCMRKWFTRFGVFVIGGEWPLLVDEISGLC